MSYDIVTIGPLLCEIMRKELDKPLGYIADFAGPYPSGDPAIMINAAGRLGAKCGIIGVIGNDDFGRCIISRLEKNGVDCSMVRIHPQASTGVAFVSYQSNGSRDFLFHVKHAASGMLCENDINDNKLKGTKILHISGFTMSVSEGSAKAVLKLITQLPKETLISFDPNIRSGVLSVDEIRSMCAPVIDRAAIIFPSQTEAAMLTGASSDEDGCKMWASSGKIVVLKNGEAGCQIYLKDEIYNVSSILVNEVDPTGAGDTFCGAFLVALLESKDLVECGRFANIAGALSVRKLGPMEGAPTREEVDCEI